MYMCVYVLDTVEKYFSIVSLYIDMHKKQHATNICQRFVCQSLFDFIKNEIFMREVEMHEEIQT